MRAERPDTARARDLIQQGVALRRAERPWEAVEPLEKALAIVPSDIVTLIHLGHVLTDVGRIDEAVRHLRRAIAAAAASAVQAEAHYALGRALLWQGDLSSGFKHLQRALALKPDMAEPRLLWARVLLEQGQYTDAIASYRRVLQFSPQSADAHAQLGEALAAAGQFKAAITSYDDALRIDPRHHSAHLLRGWALARCGRLPEAIDSLEKAVALRPDDRSPDPVALHCYASTCDWSGLERARKRLRGQSQGMSAADPFIAMAVSDDPAELLEVSRAHAKWSTSRHVPMTPAPPYPHDRIRVAYLSRDYFAHATSYLMAELFELHDRTAFRIFGVSYGPDDGSAVRQRIAKTCDPFADVAGQSDQQIANWLRAQQIDIAVDLKGYTALARSGILAHRPAPIQVSYLGYPGTMAAPFMDYLIADEFLIPEAERPFYTEKIAYMPDSYQVNDRKRQISEATGDRRESGLPRAGFVFCCFNVSWKITAPVFDVWMRLLRDVEGSVLWLLEDNRWAEENLKREAVRRGISAERLIFASRRRHPDHLARHRLADLFLDTLPYNAHTTASDALWAGLPVVTCAGRSFAARVAGSLLRAVGLQELVTSTLEEYEELALRLAREPERLSAVRTRLAQNRDVAPLFDTPRFCRHLEAAYRRMWTLHQRGLPPETFRVEPSLRVELLPIARRAEGPVGSSTSRRGDASQGAAQGG